jgi:predicted DsbA family dithiol-disulfide isomerase
MSRRSFILTAASAALPASLLLISPARGQSDDKPYTGFMLPERFQHVAGKPIQVTLFFSYRCDPCWNLEPTFYEWVKSNPDVMAGKMHVGWNAPLQVLQRLYMAMGQMVARGDMTVAEHQALHEKIFSAIQKDAPSKRLDQEEILLPWLAQQGLGNIKLEQLKEIFADSETFLMARGPNELMENYGIMSVPSMIIIGKRFYVTTAQMAGGNANMLKAADEVIGLVRKGE